MEIKLNKLGRIMSGIQSWSATQLRRKLIRDCRESKPIPPVVLDLNVCEHNAVCYS